MKQKILLVYNADQGFVAAIKDAIHKAVKPETYPCSLCQITYGFVSMHRSWRKYLNRLPMEKLFFHRQDFRRSYPAGLNNLASDFALPAILLERGSELILLLGKDRLDQIKDVETLIIETDQALKDTS